MKQIVEYHKQVTEKKKNLAVLKRQAGGIISGPVGQITINVKNAFNLPRMPAGQLYNVVILQGNLRHTTQAKPGPDAVFNEAVQVTIENEFQNLVVQIEQSDAQKRIVFKNEISFEDINDPAQKAAFQNW